MGQDPPSTKFRIPADFAEMSLLRTRIREFLSATKAPFDDGAREEIVLALDEAASNIIQHAYPDCCAGEPQPEQAIDVEFAVENNAIVIRLWDDGPPHGLSCDSGGGNSIDEADESGRGLFIMAATMTDLRFERTDDDRNLLVMRRSTQQSSWAREG